MRFTTVYEVRRGDNSLVCVTPDVQLALRWANNLTWAWAWVAIRPVVLK